MKVLLVGDVHAADTPPRFCTDAYLSDVDKVLGELIPRAIGQTGAELVAFVGDLFHHKAPKRTSHALVARMMRTFERYESDYGVVPDVVPGNHDIQHDRLGSLADSPLGVLEQAGVIDYLMPRPHTPTYGMCGLPWTSSELGDKAMSMIDQLQSQLVVAHAPLYPPGKELRFEYWDIEMFVELLPEQVTHVYYGHVHDNHGIWSYTSPAGRTVVFCNHGAVSRGSISESDLTRPVGLTVWDSEVEGMSAFTFLDMTKDLTPVGELFRLEEAAEGKENTTSAQSWIDAVQQIYTAANSMGELMRALHEEQGEHGPDVVARAEELVREVDQRE
jgi:DNA repair exonuclease SbcCD nuclease subunit